MMDLCLLGCGGMMPLPGRFLTSLVVRVGGHGLLIDCGEGTQIAMRQAGQSFKPIDTIALTHFHGDHVCGLPGLLLTLSNSGREAPVTILGPRGLTDVVRALRVVAPELPFEVRCREIDGAEEAFPLEGFRLRAFRVEHSVPCYGYVVELDRQPRFDAGRARAAGIPVRLWSVLQRGERAELDGVTYEPQSVLGEARRGLKVTYVTDTRPTEAIRRHAEGSDLMICEGMYGSDEWLDKAMEKKHMTFPEAAALARDAAVRALWLTHFSPALDAPEDYIDAARAIFPQTQLGEDGLKARLRFDEA